MVDNRSTRERALDYAMRLHYADFGQAAAPVEDVLKTADKVLVFLEGDEVE